MQKASPHACKVIHREVVDRVRKAMPDEEDHISELGRFFKVFGDPTRLKILYALTVSEMCVCDIAALLGMQHSAISHQFTTLNGARLVKQRKRGKVVYYSLRDKHVKTLLSQGLEHITE
jgi:ArsR family transcriptional regulator